MNVFWIISGTDIVNNEVLFSEIDRHGDKYCKISAFENVQSRFECDHPSVFGPTIALAPLNVCRDLYKTNLYPGAYCTLNNFKCSTYYTHFRKDLLNSDYIFLPYGDVLARKEDIFSWLGNNGSVFIRPDSGFKSFTGQVVNYATFERDISSLSSIEQDQNELCLIAEPRNIMREWRLVIGNRRVVVSSQYKSHKISPSGRIVPIYEQQCGSPQRVLDFANSVLSGVAFQPDLLYTIDVAEIADGMASRLKIIELNSFSASGWYTYNVPELVKRTREIVIQDYLDIYGE